MTTTRCELCGKQYEEGGPYATHLRSCRRRPTGDVRKLYPIPIPIDIYEAFKAKCGRQGQTLAQRVWMLVERDVR